MPPAHATGGTDYYVPYVQHLWEPSYVPPMRNDVIAERLSGQGHDILFEHEMVKLLHGEGTVTGAIFKTTVATEGRLQADQRQEHAFGHRRLCGQPRHDARPSAGRRGLLHRFQLQPHLHRRRHSGRALGRSL